MYQNRSWLNDTLMQLNEDELATAKAALELLTRKRLFNGILTRPSTAHMRQHKDFSDEVAIQLSLVAKP
jgi:hypothetical protein